MSKWFTLWRDSVRDSNWSGTAVIVRKAHREDIVGDALGTVGTNPAFGSTTVPERWILVVHDDAVDDDIYLDVMREEWAAHEVGDTFTVT